MKNKQTIIKNTLIIIILIILLPILFIAIRVGIYLYDQHKNFEMRDECYVADASYRMETKEMHDPAGCFAKMFDLVQPLLLLYKVKLKNDIPLNFLMIDDQSVYYVPEFAVNYTDALISYGVGRTCTFEDNYNMLFNKPAYAYDCGNKTNICKKAHFEPQCIGTGVNALTYKTVWDFKHPTLKDNQIHELKDKLKELKLDDKQVLLKMNIIGAEDKVMKGVLENSDNIPVILLYIHYKNPKMMIKKLKTLKALNEKYYLVAKTNVPVANVILKIAPPLLSDKYVEGYFSRNFTLTYVNKNLVEKAYIPLNQDSRIQYEDKVPPRHEYIHQYVKINWVVVVAERLRQIFGISYE